LVLDFIERRELSAVVAQRTALDVERGCFPVPSSRSLTWKFTADAEKRYYAGAVISPRTILAAVNFSDGSHAPLALAARLARRCGAEPHVLFVEDPLLDAGANRAGIHLAASSRAELRRLITDEWPAAECPPLLHVVAGPEVDVVLDVAREQGADLIVVGDRHLSRLERLVFGSFIERLLRRSDVSVLVAPVGWTPPEIGTPDAAAAGDVLDRVLESRLEVVRGATESEARRIACRALSAATVPILMQIVESVLG
jgi:nucleotide-binding universal stress UspA family protein